MNESPGWHQGHVFAFHAKAMAEGSIINRHGVAGAVLQTPRLVKESTAFTEQK